MAGTVTRPVTRMAVMPISITRVLLGINKFSHHTLYLTSLVRSAPISSHIQLREDPSTTTTTAASVSGRPLEQRSQGKNILVNHVNAATHLTLTIGSNSSCLTIPCIIFLPHPTTLAGSMLVI